MNYTIMRALDRIATGLRSVGLGRVTRSGRRVLEQVAHQGIRVDIQGFSLMGGVRDRSFLYRAQDGLFEPHTIGLMLQALRPGAIMVDVGAYLGYYTLLAARQVGASGRVYAFEPDPASFAWLLRNLHANECRNVVALRKALSHIPGTYSMYRSSSDPSRSSMAARHGWDEQFGVESETADRCVDAQAVDVVKIDVEGAETSVLLGMSELLARSPDPILFVELNPTALQENRSSQEELIGLLKTLGFQYIERLDEEFDDHRELQLCNLYCRRTRGNATPHERANT